MDDADFFELIDILESGKEKDPVPFDQLNADSIDFEQAKRDLIAEGKWPISS